MSCCSKSYDKPLSMCQRNPRCLPIPVPRGDKYFGERNLGCLNFIRAQHTLNNDCKLGGSPFVIYLPAVPFIVRIKC